MRLVCTVTVETAANEGGVTLGGDGTFRRLKLGKRAADGGRPLGPGWLARRRREKIMA